MQEASIEGKESGIIQENDVVSVIVPLYNGELYIEKCLQFLLSQTYPKIEVIVIDDGSEDGGREIANRYSASDSRVKVLSKVNGGVSSARNYGIDNSTGKYILFADVDDQIPSNSIEILLSYMSDKIDMVIGKIEGIETNGKILGIRSEEIHKPHIIAPDESYGFLPKEQHLSACGVLYKRKVVKNIRFCEDICIGEDALFHNEIFLQCNKVMMIPEVVYIYLMREGSAFKSSYSPKRFTEIDAWNRICNLYRNNYRAYKAVRGEYCVRCINVYKQMILSCKNPIDNEAYLRNEIKDNYKYLKNCRANTKWYLIGKVECISKPLLKMIYYLLHISKNRRE